MLADLVAERATISGACKSRDNYLDICDVVNSGSFTDEVNVSVWHCLAHIYEDDKPLERVDIATLMSVANSKGFSSIFSSRGDTDLVRGVLSMDLDGLSVRKMAAKVRKLDIARQALDRVHSVQASLSQINGSESVESIIASLEGPILDFSASINEGGGTIKRLGQDAEAYILHKLANPVQRMGISTGLDLYDEFIGGGIRANSANVIAARMKQGKSQVCANIGINTAYRGFPTLLLDTEMSEEEQLDRILSRLSRVEAKKIEKGVPGHTEADKQSLLEAARKLRDMPIDYKVIRGMEFEEVIAFCRRWVHKNVGFEANGMAKPCVLVYDYLKLMDEKGLSKNMAEYQSLGFMMTGLKNFMGRYGVGSLITAQTNRDGIEGESTATIAGSDRIGWFCTSLALYKEKTPEEKEEMIPIKCQHYTHKIHPLVTRWGERYDPNNYINIEADYKIARVKEGPTSFELSNKLLKKTGQTPAPPGGPGAIDF